MRILLFFIGYGFAVSGGISFIMYLNLLAAGMTWGEYGRFVMQQPECLLFFAGWLLMIFGSVE